MNYKKQSSKLAPGVVILETTEAAAQEATPTSINLIVVSQLSRGMNNPYAGGLVISL